MGTRQSLLVVEASHNSKQKNRISIGTRNKPPNLSNDSGHSPISPPASRLQSFSKSTGKKLRLRRSPSKSKRVSSIECLQDSTGWTDHDRLRGNQEWYRDADSIPVSVPGGNTVHTPPRPANGVPSFSLPLRRRSAMPSSPLGSIFRKQGRDRRLSAPVLGRSSQSPPPSQQFRPLSLSTDRKHYNTTPSDFPSLNRLKNGSMNAEQSSLTTEAPVATNATRPQQQNSVPKPLCFEDIPVAPHKEVCAPLPTREGPQSPYSFQESPTLGWTNIYDDEGEDDELNQGLYTSFLDCESTDTDTENDTTSIELDLGIVKPPDDFEDVVGSLEYLHHSPANRRSVSLSCGDSARFSRNSISRSAASYADSGYGSTSGELIISTSSLSSPEGPLFGSRSSWQRMPWSASESNHGTSRERYNYCALDEYIGEP
jgi:hypothetical protein